jgi:dTDP-4-amino-4,6-dideoxygalactose transaminase
MIPIFELSKLHAEMADDLEQAWQQVRQAGAFVGGEFVERFEAEWAAYCGVGHCVGVANGTDALELCLAALGIGRGDEVIVPANTFIATAEAVANVGATPVFVDVEPSTLLITASHVEAAITPRTAAVIAVHLYGLPVDMDAIRRVASAAGVAVLEDAAQAHGARWRGRPVGSLSDAGCFSFYPSKNLGAWGDGGAVVTQDGDLAERVRSLGNHGRASTSRDHHALGGRNSRLDGIQAAILSAKLKRLDGWVENRRRIARAYRAALAGLPVAFQEAPLEAFHSYHLAVLRTPHRERLRRHLADAGIGTGIHYPVPCHRQPAFTSEGQTVLKVAEQAAGEILSVPMYPHLSDQDVGRIVQAIGEVIGEVLATSDLALAS